MKNTFLLSCKFKRIGMWMFIPFCVLCLWCIISGELEFDYLQIPAPAFCVEELGGNASFFEMVQNDPINEIAMLGFLVSLCFIALSKEQDEDEMIKSIRLKTIGILAIAELLICVFFFSFWGLDTVFGFYQPEYGSNHDIFVRFFGHFIFCFQFPVYFLLFKILLYINRRRNEE